MFARPGCIILAWVFLGATASAQSTTSLPDGNPSYELTRPPSHADSGAWSSPSEATRPSGGVDLIFGLPTCVRLFWQLGMPDDHCPQVEGIFGLYYILPTAGAGLRWQFAPISGARNALALRPGLDGYVLLNPFFGSDGWYGGGNALAGLIAADVEVACQHRFDGGCVGELGIKLGGGLAFSANTGFLPIVGLFCGLRF